MHVPPEHEAAEVGIGNAAQELRGAGGPPDAQEAGEEGEQHEEGSEGGGDLHEVGCQLGVITEILLY